MKDKIKKYSLRRERFEFPLSYVLNSRNLIEDIWECIENIWECAEEDGRNGRCTEQLEREFDTKKEALAALDLCVNSAYVSKVESAKSCTASSTMLPKMYTM